MKRANIFYFFLHKTAQLSRFFYGAVSNLLIVQVDLELLQVNLMSFLASGASFLGCEFVPHHIKSDEGQPGRTF